MRIKSNPRCLSVLEQGQEIFVHDPDAMGLNPAAGLVQPWNA